MAATGGPRELMGRHALDGHLDWIGLRPARGAAMVRVAEVRAVAGRGLLGDRWGARGGGKRQVSLLQAEHLPVIAGLLGADSIAPQLLRRNLVVSGINLHALRHDQFRIGDVLFEGSGECAPCSKLERVLGPGGYNASRGHAGILARVIEAGVLRLGDPVWRPARAETGCLFENEPPS